MNSGSTTIMCEYGVSTAVKDVQMPVFYIAYLDMCSPNKEKHITYSQPLFIGFALRKSMWSTDEVFL